MELILTSLKEIEEATERHRAAVSTLEEELNRKDDEKTEKRMTSDCEDNGASLKNFGSRKDRYIPPTELTINHPSKNATSSLKLAKDYRAKFDCIFNVNVSHTIPLCTKKAVWIGGYFMNPAIYRNPSYQGTIYTPSPYFDLNSGIYKCSLTCTYEFQITCALFGEGGVTIYLCRDVDGVREVVAQKTLLPQQPQPVDATIKWECQAGTLVWIEAVRSNGETTLENINFSGKTL